MTKTLGWHLLACAWLFSASCTDHDQSKHADTDSHPSQDATHDAGSALDASSDASANHDADESAKAEPVDQTPPAGANGLAFDSDKMVWLADLFGKQLLRLNPANGEILARFVPEGLGPDDVVIDARGRVFWTDWSGGHVGRLDPKTLHNEFVATLPTGANSIAFSEDGRLFVALVLLHHGLYEIDPEGVREPRLITDAISSLNAFNIGPDGLLWGPLEDKIVKIDLDSGEIVETIAQGGYASVRYNQRDHALYALSNGANKQGPVLEKIDVDDFSVTRFYAPELASVDNFVVDPAGNFVVTGYDMPKFVTIDPAGSHAVLTQIGTAP